MNYAPAQTCASFAEAVQAIACDLQGPYTVAPASPQDYLQFPNDAALALRECRDVNYLYQYEVRTTSAHNPLHTEKLAGTVCILVPKDILLPWEYTACRYL